jgi:hypothetical protein
MEQDVVRGWRMVGAATRAMLQAGGMFFGMSFLPIQIGSKCPGFGKDSRRAAAVIGSLQRRCIELDRPAA